MKRKKEVVDAAGSVLDTLVSITPLELDFSWEKARFFAKPNCRGNFSVIDSTPHEVAFR